MSRHGKLTAQDKLRFIKEYGGTFDPPPFAAMATLLRDKGFYHERSSVGDIELALMHVWQRRKSIEGQTV